VLYLFASAVETTGLCPLWPYLSSAVSHVLVGSSTIEAGTVHTRPYPLLIHDYLQNSLGSGLNAEVSVVEMPNAPFVEWMLDASDKPNDVMWSSGPDQKATTMEELEAVSRSFSYVYSTTYHYLPSDHPHHLQLVDLLLNYGVLIITWMVFNCPSVIYGWIVCRWSLAWPNKNIGVMRICRSGRNCLRKTRVEMGGEDW